MSNDNARLQGRTVLVGEPGAARREFLRGALTEAGMHVIGPVPDAASLQGMLDVFSIDAVLVNAALLQQHAVPPLLAGEAGLLVFGSEAKLAASSIPDSAQRLAGPLTPPRLRRALQMLLAARDAAATPEDLLLMA
ncbi:hypothetical protein [Roseomonas sp. 18066]|uniref:hypothetical protein n=1 Tax=Roseomonas sp. 18066 TaxID=2681412 RepID=UPI001358ACF3|nr:hypothetical protein [Roseomonas sp. 18066]